MPFQHILVAYDGSRQAQSALDQAAALVRLQPNSRLTIAHVYHLPNFAVGEALVMAPVNASLDQLSESERILEEAKDRTVGLANTETVLLQGDPAVSILEYAAEHQADLIVIGSRGLNTLKELFLGSVSHYIVQHAKMAVLVTK